MTKAQLTAQLSRAWDLEAEPILLADGFEAACRGVIRTFNRVQALYDYAACCRILRERDGLTPEEAEEWMEVNVLGAYVGDGTPAFWVIRLHPPPIPKGPRR